MINKCGNKRIGDAASVSGGGFIEGQVDTYGDLPSPASDYIGKFFLVKEGSGGILSVLNVYKYPAGLYTPNSSNVWELAPFNVKLAEDSMTLVNITNWSEFIGYAFDISVGDRLIYDGATYVNLTGTQTSTAPDTDTTNWAFPIMFSRSMTFDTGYTPSSPSAGTIWYNNKEYTVNIETGLGPTIQIGEEILLLYYNDTGVDIPNFSILRPKAAAMVGGIVVPTPELAQSNVFSSCEGTLSVATQIILNGQLGFAVRFGRARSGDTSGFSPGDGLWLSETNPGELTNVEPEFPNYKISMGGALNSETSPDGEVFVSVTRDIFNTITDAWDGSIRESINLFVDSDGTTITGSLSNQFDDTRNLTLMFSDGFSTLDTTPAATVTLTPGTDSNPQTNYVYIPKSSKVLTVSTSDWPTTTEHIKVAVLALRSAATTKTEGVFRNQNWNDHIKQEDDNGHLLHLSEKLRQFEAQWNSGAAVTGVVGAGALNVFLTTTAGVIYQLHRQNFPVFSTIPYGIDSVSQGSQTFTLSGDGDLTSTFPDGRFVQVSGSTGNDGIYTIASTSFSSPDFVITVEEAIPSATADGNVGDDIHVVNDFTTPYTSIQSLSEVTTDASGVSLNNTSFSVVIWGVMNKTGQTSHLMANYPTSTYNKNFPDLAVSDASNYSVYSIPKTFQGVGFLMARLTLVNNGGVYSIYDTEDLRGRVPNTTAGGGAGGAGVTDFTGLTDTPNSYASQAGAFPVVNSGETALEFLGLITSQSGAPSSTPSQVGLINIDTSGGNVYISTGISSSADWKRCDNV